MLSNYLRCNKDILRRLDIVPLWISQKSKTFARNLNQPFTENRIISGSFDRRRDFPKGRSTPPWRVLPPLPQSPQSFFSQALCSLPASPARGERCSGAPQIVFRSKPVLALHQCRMVVRVGSGLASSPLSCFLALLVLVLFAVVFRTPRSGLSFAEVS